MLLGATFVCAAHANPTDPASPTDTARRTPLEWNEERPRIGLALSGGGARGGAHIGVLRELEAMRIPIDHVTGTSMGAVVGGLYAAGLSPAQIERALVDTDWAEAFEDARRRGNG